MNIQNSQIVLQRLLDEGVREFCVCAGARNAPLVMMLDQMAKSYKELRVHSFFEERSSAFFALGRAVRTQLPVVIVTTSGTAVAELLPAAVEATYQGVPLIFLTADRPKSFRGSGSPQTIEQVGIFSHYVEATLDLDENSKTEKELAELFSSFSWQKPLHLNLCFKEPLLEGFQRDYFPIATLTNYAKSRSKKTALISPIKISAADFEAPLVILGQIPKAHQEQVAQSLSQLQVPIYAEALSGLRAHPALQKLLLQAGEKTISWAFGQGLLKSVLRIGSVPTLRFWRDLEDRWLQVPVAVFSDLAFSGLGRRVSYQGSYFDFHEFSDQKTDLSKSTQIAEKDRSFQTSLLELAEKWPLSEQNFIAKISTGLMRGQVYLGNSLPIREWDLMADLGPLQNETPAKTFFANRGANGIDGQLSTFLGWAQAQDENWALVGDLTALYDLSSLWIDRWLSPGKYRIVIINNGGGQIFQNIFKHPAFINQHQLGFAAWAQMWSWDYVKWDSPSQLTRDLPDKCVIEIIPDNSQTQKFWEELRSL